MPAELIVALDVPDAVAIGPVLAALPPEVGFYKVGLELFTAAGPDAVQALTGAGKRVFLDLKLHDIPRTTARAVAAAARHNVSLLTLHAGGGRAMLEAAVAAARDTGPDAPRLIAVTALTSLDRDDLAAVGVNRSPADHARKLGALAMHCGLDGLVCSPLEVAALRAECGPDAILVTPGIRPTGDAAGDQKRIATPGAAVAAGASHLVVGRPILDAVDPAGAARGILAEMAAAQTGGAPDA